MKKLFILFFSTVLILSSCNMSLENKSNNKPLNSGDPMLTEAEFAQQGTYTGYSIVKVSENFDITDIEKCGGKICDILSFLDGSTYYLVEGVTSPDSVMRENLNKTAGVVYAIPDYVIEAPKYTVDEREEQSEGHAEEWISTMGILDSGKLLNEGEDGNVREYSLYVTKACDFFDENGVLQQGAYTSVGYGSNISVAAIIDTGINANHEDFFDLSNNSILLYAKSAYTPIKDRKASLLNPGQTNDILHNFTPFRELAVPSNEDEGGHGTHCSGIIAAVGDNGKGTCGAAWKNTHLISYKGMFSGGGGAWAIYGSLGDLTEIVTILKKEPSARTSAERNRIPAAVTNRDPNYRIKQKVVPVNMSLGGNGPTSYFTYEMINKALAANVLPVIAMGNEGRTITSNPAAIQGVLSVGATTKLDTKAIFSNSENYISICAPGHNIYSASNCWKGSTPPASGADVTGSKMMSGTSMATPFVTGVIAYLLSFPQAENLTAYQFKTILEQTADKIDADNPHFGYTNGFSKYYGYGRINVLEAAKCVTQKAGARPIPAVGSVYREKPVTVSFDPASTAVSRRIFLFETATDIPVGVASTDTEGKVEFRGLKIGTEYTVVFKWSVTGGWKNFTVDKDSEINIKLKRF